MIRINTKAHNRASAVVGFGVYGGTFCVCRLVMLFRFPLRGVIVSQKKAVVDGGEIGVKYESDGLPAVEILDQLFELGRTDGEVDGRLFHKWRGIEWFGDGNKAVQKMWNAKMAGQPAINTMHNDGYGQGTIFNRRVLAHRIVYKMVYRCLCPDLIDHEDGNPINNRPDNLRPANQITNHRNRKRNTNNTSGVNGVSWNKADKVWRVIIGVGEKKNKYLGRFKSLEEAIAVRKAAEVEYGYSARHGSVPLNPSSPGSGCQNGDQMVGVSST